MDKELFFKSKGTAPGTVIYEGDSAPVHTLITYYKIANDGVVEANDVIDYDSQNGNIIWVRITGLSDSEKILRNLTPLGIDVLTLEDVFETYHNPKFDNTFGYNFIIMRSLNITPNMQDNQISFIHKKGILITFEEYRCEEFNIVLQRVYKNFNNFHNRGSDYLLYALIDAVVDNYLVILNKINLSVDSLEDFMTRNTETPCDTSELFTLKRHINFVARHTRNSYDIAGKLLKLSAERAEAGYISTVPYYEDLCEHTTHLNEVTSYCKDSIHSLYAENMSRMQLKSNKFINILTLLSTLMLPPMVIGGIFGMNFNEIPFSSFPYGFALSIFFMFTISFILAWYFKKKNFF